MRIDGYAVDLASLSCPLPSKAIAACAEEAAKQNLERQEVFMIPPIEKTITVPCSPEQAFDIFLTGMGSWWPLDKFTYSAMKGAPAKDVRIDPRPGGGITEIGADGAETSWGHVVDYAPHSHMELRFHIPAPGHEDGGQSLLRIAFAPVDGGTRVDLRQSDFEAIGEMGEPSSKGYSQGWVAIFEGAYANACAAAAK